MRTKGRKIEKKLGNVLKGLDISVKVAQKTLCHSTRWVRAPNPECQKPIAPKFYQLNITFSKVGLVRLPIIFAVKILVDNVSIILQHLVLF